MKVQANSQINFGATIRFNPALIKKMDDKMQKLLLEIGEQIAKSPVKKEIDFDYFEQPRNNCYKYFVLSERKLFGKKELGSRTYIDNAVDLKDWLNGIMYRIGVFK